MTWLDEGRQLTAQREARRNSPEAYAARTFSQRSYSAVSSEEAAKVDGEAFPSVINEPAGGPPALPLGQTITNFPSPFVAQVSLGVAKAHAMIASLQPMAVESSHGTLEAINLALGEAAGQFAPTLAAVPVQIPKQLSEGARLQPGAIAITPVDGEGHPLTGSEGKIDGASVFYANTQASTDAVLKPTTAGIEIHTMLRSIEAPQQLFFRFTLPEGATLQMSSGGSSEAQVLAAGEVLARTPAPTARDAEGTPVPLTMSVSGDTLAVTLAHPSSEYRFPIDVDPTVEVGKVEENDGGTGGVKYGGEGATWGFETNDPSAFKAASGGIDQINGSIVTGQFGFFYYRTQGQSRIYEFKPTTTFSEQGAQASQLEDIEAIFNPHTKKTEPAPPVKQVGYAPSEVHQVCALSECQAGTVTSENEEGEALFQQNERKEGGETIYQGRAQMGPAYVYILQEAPPRVSADTTDRLVRNKFGELAPNALYANTWVRRPKLFEGPDQPEVAFNTFDPGTGVIEKYWSSPSRPGWGHPPAEKDRSKLPTAQWDECYEAACKGLKHPSGQPIEGPGEPWPLGINELPEGEDAIEGTAEDAVGLRTTATGTVKIDEKPPYSIALTGLPQHSELGYGTYKLKVSASDGSGSTASSGVEYMQLAIDGAEVGYPNGSCTPGPCTATGGFTVNGSEYAAGKHLVEMTATDAAGNAAKATASLIIHAAESQPLGPGAVNLASGAFTTGASDVAVASPGAGLSVTRSYASRQVVAGEVERPFGPQWQGLSFAGAQSLSKLPTGSMILTSSSGSQAIFPKEGSSYVSPPGDANLTLKELSASEFSLEDKNHDVTTFTLPEGGSGTVFTPHTRTEPGHAGVAKYTYRTVAGVTEPTQELAPVPSGVSCELTLVKGCRALTFTYAPPTTKAPSGEAPSQWGEYAGRLATVSFTAYDPATGVKKMRTIPLAEYAYDSQGRLRAEWDPRVSPALKTTYGYDSEGHLTAISAPGQQPWLLHYGTIPGDTTGGRVLSATQPPAATPFGNGVSPTSSGAPALSSSSPTLGSELTVSNGSWENSPLAYAYQWERCNAEGTSCTPIAGATNPNYTVTQLDAGTRLLARVSATNAAGTTTAVSAASTAVPASGPTYAGEIGTWGFSKPAGVALDGKGDVWVADTGDSQVKEFNEKGENIRAIHSPVGAESGFYRPQGIALDASGNVWVADTGNNRVVELGSSGEFLQRFGSLGSGTGRFHEPAGIALDAKGHAWIADARNGRIEEFSTQLSYRCETEPFYNCGEKSSYIASFGSSGTGVGQFKEPQGVAVGPNGKIWVADSANNRIEQFSEGGEYKTFGAKGSEPGQFLAPASLALDASGNVWVADSGNDRIQELSEAGAPLAQVGRTGAANGLLNNPEGIALLAGGGFWVADTNNNRLEHFSSALKYAGQYGWGRKPRRVAVDAQGNVWFTGGAGGWEYSSAGKELQSFGSSQVHESAGIALAQGGDLWVTDRAEGRIAEFGEKGEFLRQAASKGSQAGQLSSPEAIAVDASGDVWVADWGNARLEEFSPSGEYERQIKGEGPSKLHGPTGLAIDAQGHLWVGESGRVMELTETGVLIQSFSASEVSDISVDSQGNVWVASLHSAGETPGDVVEYNSSGELETQFGGPGVGEGQFEGVSGVSAGPGGSIWAVDAGNARLEKWTTPVVSVAAAKPSASGWTVEYQAPVAGSAAPTQLSPSKVATWAQQDDPVEATAIFPPDEPMGWPASDYRRASLYYRDSRDRTVNVAAPGSPEDSISTAEYNATNDVVRSLSADNRAAALKEGTKSAEVAKLLDSESTYNPEGNQLSETLGPQHEVMLAIGVKERNEKTLARARTRYFYNENAPSEGGPYNVLTKTVADAVLPGGEGRDPRTSTTSFAGAGWKLHKPTSTITDPSGLHISRAAAYEESTGNQIESTMPAGASANPVPAFSFAFGSSGTGEGQFQAPWGVAVSPKTGNIFVSDYAAGRVEQFEANGKFKAWIPAPGALTGQLVHPEALAFDTTGKLYVGDGGSARVVVFKEKEGKWEFSKFIGLPTGGSQFGGPIHGILYEPTAKWIWVSDTANNRVQAFTTTGLSKGEFGGPQEAGGVKLREPAGLALSSGHIYVDDYGEHRVVEVNGEGKFTAAFSALEGGQQLESPLGLAADPKSGDLYVSDYGLSRVEQFKPDGTFIATIGAYGSGNGQFVKPIGVASAANGALEVVDSANARVEVWAPGASGAHSTQTIYYTALANSKLATCGKHPEWANLPCETRPAEQPGTPGLPSLPETSVKYNVWDEPETTTETFPATVPYALSMRTSKTTYDGAGRVLSSEVTASSGTAIPKVTDTYNEATGALEKQTSTIEGTERTIESKLNSLGQLVAYSDADGNEATYEYDADGRPHKVNDGRGTQTYTYDDETTGLLKTLQDSGAGTFTASYDPEGKLLTEGYPNGMTAQYTYASSGGPVNLEYVKASCSCSWFSDKVVPSIHGQWLEQTSSLSKQVYSYDAAGRLTQVQSTPAGKGCTTRIYAYDEDTNRLSLTSDDPNEAKGCATEKGSVEAHAYDPADRLNDAGVGYDAFGNTTSLSAQDAGSGSPPSALISTFYADNQTATLTQSKETIGYHLDPAGRTRETVETGSLKTAAIVSHYASAGNAPAWTSNSSEEWSRNIPGIDGSLAAVQTSSRPEATLQLANLHGDVVATAYDSPSAGELASKADTTEFGVPAVNAPPKYSWLGAIDLPTAELPASPVAMGARSYVPQLGRFLQRDPVAGGSANAYAYTFGDPVNSSDPSGAYTIGNPSEQLLETAGRLAEEGAAQQAAENAAARREAEERLAAELAAREAAFGGGEEWGEYEEWEEWEEGEEFEYASYRPGAGYERRHRGVEPAVLYQPLTDEGAAPWQEPSVGTPRDANDICHVWPYCGGSHSILSRAIKNRVPRRRVSFCEQLHDCPFPEPSNNSLAKALWKGAKKLVTNCLKGKCLGGGPVDE